MLRGESATRAEESMDRDSQELVLNVDPVLRYSVGV